MKQRNVLSTFGLWSFTSHLWNSLKLPSFSSVCNTVWMRLMPTLSNNWPRTTITTCTSVAGKCEKNFQLWESRCEMTSNSCSQRRSFVKTGLCRDQRGNNGVDKSSYLVFLSVLRRWGLPAEARALGGALVLPPDRATRLVSDTLNLSGAARPRAAWTGKGAGSHLAWCRATCDFNGIKYCRLLMHFFKYYQDETVNGLLWCVC